MGQRCAWRRYRSGSGPDPVRGRPQQGATTRARAILTRLSWRLPPKCRRGFPALLPRASHRAGRVVHSRARPEWRPCRRMGWRNPAVLTTFRQSARGAAWGFLDLADLIAPTDPMTDLFDKNRPRRPVSPDSARVIAIRGAREHNLKNIDLEIPRDQLVVFTGLSGSGKSSLAFDTIYAEGQRRYVE